MPLKVTVAAAANASMRVSSQLKQILTISLPVTGSRLVGATSYLLESILIAQSLAAAGIATAVATAQYGALQGMVFPILLLPSALTYSLSTSLVPSLSEAAARGDIATIHSRLNQSIKLALLSGAPFAVLMFVLASPLCSLMYNQGGSIGEMLKMLAPIALLIYVQAPLQATLQALDRPTTALFNTLIGAAVKLGLIMILASKPNFGIFGAIMAINVNIALVTALHWTSVVRLLKFRFDGIFTGKIVLTMGLSGLVCHFTYIASLEMAEAFRFLVSSAAAMAVFALCAPLLGLIDGHTVRRVYALVKKAVKP